MSKDFRASQIETSKIIASGNMSTVRDGTSDPVAQNLGIAIYSGSVATNREGGVPAKMFDDVGSDVFLFISGSKITTNEDARSRREVSLFGGDVVISGTLFAERQVIEVDGVVDGDMIVTGSLLVEPDIDSEDAVVFRKADSSDIFVLNTSDSIIEITGSLSQGQGAQSTGVYSHAEGRNTRATDWATHAEGYNTEASQLYSHAEGVGTTASGIGAHAEGEDTTASEQGSHAEGYGTTASGFWSHAEGWTTTAPGQGSHSEGYRTSAESQYSHAEGRQTNTIYGEYSHAEGYLTTASGDYSHTQGYLTKTSKESLYTHAAGIGTLASGSGQFVVGKYNKKDNSDSLFVVGFGSGDSSSQRDDIFLINSGSVIIGSGTLGTDVNFYVTGSAGSKGTLTKGTSVFDGDLVISGTTYHENDVEITGSLQVNGDISVEAGNRIYFNGDAGDVSIYSTNGNNIFIDADDLAFIDFDTNLGFRYSGQNLFAINDTAIFFNSARANRDFYINGDSNYGTFLIDSADESIIIGHEDFDSSPEASEAPGYGNDVKIMLSGSIGTKGSSDRGVVLIPGDIVISGSTYYENNVQITGSLQVDGDISLQPLHYLRFNNPGDDDISIRSLGNDDLWIDGDDSVSLVADESVDMYIGGLSNTFHSANGYQSLNTGRGKFDFSVMTDNYMTLLVSGGHDSVIIGSDEINYAALGRNIPGYGNDVKIMLSGSIGTKDSSIRGVVLVPGDMVISGSLYDASGNIIDAISTSTGTFHVPTPTTMVTTSSVSFSGEEGFNYDPTNVGVDVYFFVSGSIGGKDTTGTSVFGGDLLVSGAIYADSSIDVAGDLNIDQFIKHTADPDTYIQFADDSIGITVGNEQLITLSQVDAGQDIVKIGDGGDVDFQVRTDGNDNTLYIRGDNDNIGIGTSNPLHNVTITNPSNVSLMIESGNGGMPASSSIAFRSGAGSSIASMISLEKTGDLHIVNSGSNKDIVFVRNNGGDVSEAARFTENQVLILSGGAGSSLNPQDFTDTNFFVSGSIGSRGTSTKGTTVFGGDVVISGSSYHELGISGSLTQLTDGTSYLIAGSNITITSASNGAVTISSLAGGGSDVDWADGGDKLFTTSSVSINTDGNYIESYGSDLFFYTSGSIDGKGTSGVSAFGGDLVVSGTLYISEKIIHEGDNNSYIHFNAPDSLKFFLDGKQFISLNSNDQNILFNAGQRNDISTVIFTDNKTAFAADAANDRVLILSGGAASSVDESKGADVNFFVSGSTLSKGTSEKGTAIFGGDLVVSGAIYTGRLAGEEDNTSFIDLSENNIEINANHTVSIHDVMPSEFTDTNFFVSGSIGSKGNPSIRGVSTFGGDVYTSGSAYFGSTSIFEGGIHEIYSGSSNPTGVFVHDCDNGHLFYHDSLSTNFTANFTNLNLNQSHATTLTLVLSQSATAYIPNAVQIGGSAQTIYWQGNAEPAGTSNGKDVVSFTIVNDEGSYIVLGQLVDFG